MNYRDVDSLRADTRQFAEDLSQDVDLIVGIPRSGLLAANLLCLYLDVPMTDVDGLCNGEVFDTGNRYENGFSFERLDTVLVIDDSVLSGNQMTETQDRLAEHDFPFEIEYAAVYISSWGHKYVDHYADVVPLPRVFEWNILHHSLLDTFCIDIDGVLCRDPTPEENDDGENYREFLAGVEPKIVPNQPVGWLVTCRLEKYRAETEAWLDKHGIEYDNLVMMDYPDKETRQRQGDHAEYKASVYESTGAGLFIESDPAQAADICTQSGKPVFCYETQEMVRPGRINQMQQKTTESLAEFRKNPILFPTIAGKRALYRLYHLIQR